MPVFVGDALLAGARAADGSPVRQLTRAGGRPHVYTGPSGTTIGLTCRADLFEDALGVVAATVQRPVFAPDLLVPVRRRTELDLLWMRNVSWDWWFSREHLDLRFEWDARRARISAPVGLRRCCPCRRRAALRAPKARKGRRPPTTRCAARARS